MQQRAWRLDENDRMIRQQIAARGITDQRVLDAFRSVPRELFVPPQYQSSAYDDTPLPLERGPRIFLTFMAILLAVFVLIAVILTLLLHYMVIRPVVIVSRIANVCVVFPHDCFCFRTVKGHDPLQAVHHVLIPDVPGLTIE